MTHPLEPSAGHHAGIADLLQAGLTALGSPVLVHRDRVPPTTAYPYFVVWSAPAAPEAAAARLVGWGGDLTSTTQVTVAGLTIPDVLGAADRAVLVLHRRTPDVAGRVCGDIDMPAGSPGRPVESPTPGPGGLTVYFLPLLFELSSSPQPD